jgi:LemA protein
MELTLIVIVAVIAVIAIFFWATYNALVKLNVRVQEAWSDITVQLKRRSDLIPNLVEAVKGYAGHEKQVFQDVTEARSNVLNATAKGPEATAKAENMLEGALKSLFAVSEDYPELRATENFQQLSTELVDTEDKIQASRRFYNGGVRDLNTRIQQFPVNLIAGMFGFTSKEFFEVEDMASVQNPVEVKF